jgi:hypothetical protein
VKRRLILATILALGIQMSFGQPPQDPGGDGSNPDAPITGIEFLMGLGALLGLKKIKDSFSKKTK